IGYRSCAPATSWSWWSDCVTRWRSSPTGGWWPPARWRRCANGRGARRYGWWWRTPLLAGRRTSPARCWSGSATGRSGSPRRRSGGAAGGGPGGARAPLRSGAPLLGGDLPGGGGVNPVWSVAAREIVTRGRSRRYLIGLAVSVLLVAAVALLPSLFGGRTHQVGVVGGAADLPEQLVAQATAAELRVTVMRVPDEPAARAAVADRELTAVLLADRGVVLTDGGIDPRLGQVLEAAHQRHRTAQALQAAGLSPTVIEQALTVSPLVYRPVHGDETDTMAGF